MQLTIDTHSETPHALRVYAEILQTLAKLATDELANAGSPQQSLWPAPPPPPAPPAPSNPEGFLYANGTLAPPAPSNVVPFVPAPLPATAPTTALSAASAAGAVPNHPSAVSAPVGCDSTGLPWDERIHSQGENRLNTDGTWRQKRGANPMLVASVTAELRARPAQAAAPAPPVAPVATAPVSLPLPVPPPPPTLPLQQPQVADAPAAVLPTAPSPAVGPIPTTITFTQLFAAANRHGFDNDRLSALVVKAGGTGLESLVNNPALIAIVHQMVQESAGAQ